MSNTLSSPNGTANGRPTRQQLDELDALLQKMLELPVNRLAEDEYRPDAAPAGPPRPDAPPADEAGQWVPLSQAWEPSSATWGPLAERFRRALPGGDGPPENAPPPAADASLPASTSGSGSSLPETLSYRFATFPPTAPAPAARPSEPAAAAAAPRSVPGAFLAAVTWCFDLCLSPTGGLGAWLKSPAGRALLAALGFLMLAAAGAVCVADALGWTW